MPTAQHWVSLPPSLLKSQHQLLSLRPCLKPSRYRLLHLIYGHVGLLVFSLGGGGGRVNYGNLMIIQAVELLMKEKNHFLSSMYLGVLINCAADYLFYVTT